jgi:hypothetical protein
MTGDNDVPDSSEILDVDITEDDSDDAIELLADDDAGDSTEEINVDELVAKIDSTDAEESARKREIRLKLEALNEQRDDEFGSTYNFDINDDI